MAVDGVAVKFRPATAPSVVGKRIVGLDTWVWRRLAAASAGRGDASEIAALEALQHAVDDGFIVVPLASTVYMEVSGIHDYPLREEVAGLASDLSGWFTYRDISSFMREEIDVALHQMFGRPAPLAETAPVVGWGVHHAHGEGTQKLELVGDPGQIAALTQARGKDVVDVFLLKANSFAQHSVLAGADPAAEADLRANYGYKPEVSWQVAVDRAARENVVAGNLATNADLRSRVSDVIATGDLTIEMWDALTERLGAAGITGDEFIGGGRKSMDTFLDLMPGSVVRRTIREHVQRTTSRKPTVNDVNDADLFGTLVPHSDMVVLEKSAHHALTQAHIGERYNVELLRSMTDIPEVLDRLLNT